MRVSMKVDYGVRALVDLALHAEEQPIYAAEIAVRQRRRAEELAQKLESN
jgi:DNA-binding IscR family transcriptional regulator